MASLITNIKLKYDTLANWTREDMEGKGAFLVLQRGEVGFCEVPSNIEGVLPTILFKVGDGNSTFGELNWVSALASDVRPWAKAENKPEYSAAEINGLSEYITQAVKDTNTEYRFNKVNDYEYEFQSKEIGGTEWNVDFTLTIPKYDDTPAFKPYLTFGSPNSFTLKVGDATQHWDGTLEYFNSDKTWTVWDGTTTLSSVDSDGEHVLYLRGTGNTKLSYYDEADTKEYIPWKINGTGVRCDGNIETLLDYATVEAGQHPTMAEECFTGLFWRCTALITPPELPATTLASNCYYKMFSGCTALTQAPTLPATTLANYCYSYMFSGCTSLTKTPALPATTLAEACYSYMFQECTSLTQAPALPATTLAGNCYESMFYGCTALTKAPALPATTLTDFCYSGMFSNCSSLTQAPALPATTLSGYCYGEMFYGCTSLTKAPALPAMTLASNCYSSMFYGCTRLKLSPTQTGEYTQEYRIPSFGTGTTTTYALANMFIDTGGTFTGTPEINTTYYLSTDNMIVRETEIATLNGYVGAMIAASGGGLPEGATAYQQLVTDGDGNVKWEDRLAYKGEGYNAVLDSSQFTDAYTIGQNSGFSYNGQSYIIAAIDDKYAKQIPLLVMFLPGAEPFPVGAKCKVTFDDTIYNCEIVEDAEYCWHIGNMSIGQPSDYPDTGEPFCFEFGIPGYNFYIPGEYKGNGIYVYTLHGLKIEMVSETIVPIDPKWLPAALPNPNALTFTGAVTGSYDGSEPLKVNIPSLTVDNSLTQNGQAADAAEVGKRLSSLSEEIANLPQPDWNQNDNTQPDYVKNRPFYESISLTTLLEEQQIDFSSSFDIQNSIVVGKTYIVHWDDAEYTIEATNKDIFGDGSILIPYLGQADGLFTIEGTAMNAADKGIHTVAIYTSEIDRKTIDEKFIPDSLKNKISFENPIGTGAVSFNRKTDTEIGLYSFAEGSGTTASGEYSHAEGYGTTASGMGSHAEGSGTTASGSDSHAEGIGTTASGEYSHAEGYGTIALKSYCHAEGIYNIPFDEIAPVHLLHIVGNGTSEDARSNAYTLDINGNAWFAGTIEGKALILPSSTTNSTKYFRITVDDNGTISATDVTLSK